MIKVTERTFDGYYINESVCTYESEEYYMYLLELDRYILRDQASLGFTDEEEPVFELKDGEQAILNNRGEFVGATLIEEWVG